MLRLRLQALLVAQCEQVPKEQLTCWEQHIHTNDAALDAYGRHAVSLLMHAGAVFFAKDRLT